MRKLYRQILRQRKQRIQRRLQPKNFSDQPKPMFQGGNLHYEMAERIGAISCGGIGAIHTLAQQLGLVQEIDQHLQLLKVHLPYHESDHVLNFAYNIMAGGVRIQDMELRRQDENVPDSGRCCEIADLPRPSAAFYPIPARNALAISSGWSAMSARRATNSS